MQFEIKNRFDGKLIFSVEAETLKLALKMAIEAKVDLSYSDLRYSDLRGSDLRGSDLSYSDLRYSDLRYSDLRYSDLSYSDLSSSDLRCSDLRDSDLSYSDLRCSNLRYSDLSSSDLRCSNLRDSDLSYSDLRGSDLRYSDLRCSNLDFSCWGLSCKTLDVNVSARLSWQLLYHFCRLKCDDKAVQLIQQAVAMYANKFHRVDECGKIDGGGVKMVIIKKGEGYGS